MRPDLLCDVFINAWEYQLPLLVFSVAFQYFKPL